MATGGEFGKYPQVMLSKAKQAGQNMGIGMPSMPLPRLRRDAEDEKKRRVDPISMEGAREQMTFVETTREGHDMGTGMPPMPPSHLQWDAEESKRRTCVMSIGGVPEQMTFVETPQEGHDPSTLIVMPQGTTGGTGSMQPPGSNNLHPSSPVLEQKMHPEHLKSRGKSICNEGMRSPMKGFHYVHASAGLDQKMHPEHLKETLDYLRGEWTFYGVCNRPGCGLESGQEFEGTSCDLARYHMLCSRCGRAVEPTSFKPNFRAVSVDRTVKIAGVPQEQKMTVQPGKRWEFEPAEGECTELRLALVWK